jgi:hypothetical protein
LRCNSFGRFLCKKKIEKLLFELLDSFLYMPMQLVAPRAVTIAVAIDAIICTMNLMVSLFVMVV